MSLRTERLAGYFLSLHLEHQNSLVNNFHMVVLIQKSGNRAVAMYVNNGLETNGLVSFLGNML
jgi:hypothetical protein